MNTDVGSRAGSILKPDRIGWSGGESDCYDTDQARKLSSSEPASMKK
jgi:hypothetical protein